MDPSRARSTSGFAYALAAYGAWGVMPVLWKQFPRVGPFELVAHRIVWSFVAVAVLLTWYRGWREVLAVLRVPRDRRVLLLSTALISANWLIFIWAVAQGRVVEASLGYYINPLLNVLLGRLVLGEHLRPLQLLAVAIAGVGVAQLAVAAGVFPWISLALALSFAVYGIVRKQAPISPLTGLAVETGVVAPLALAWVAPLGWAGTWVYASHTGWESALLAGSGVATALPLLWFAHAARRLRYATLGIVQYLAPTLQLLIAVLVYGEPFSSTHAVTFACIWTAVALYATDTLRAHARVMQAAAAEARAAS